MPDQRIGDHDNRESPTADRVRAAGPGSVDARHLLLVGAGPGLGTAVARRFAVGGYRVTLLARSPDGLSDMAGSLADTGAKISTIAADASDPDDLGARVGSSISGMAHRASSSTTPSWELRTGC
jgi:shikimate 5-dehydrogenase